MTTTLTPFSSRSNVFDDFRREMDQLMGRFFGTENGGTELANWTPRLNLSETENQYEISVDLPGTNPENFNVEIRHGDLWITGERKGEKEEKGKAWHRLERYYGAFRRVVRLGDDVDPENIEAEYKDGVLYISVPKTEEAKTRKITIKS